MQRNVSMIVISAVTGIVRFLTAGNIGGNNMQNNTVKAFRQRLVRAGFTDICISNSYRGYYFFSCISPDGVKIERLLTEIEMINIPRTVWFD